MSKDVLINIFTMYSTLFTILLAAVVGYTDCQLSTSEETMTSVSIESNNTKPSLASNTSLTPCNEPYNANFCLNGGQCFNVTVNSYSIPSCECPNGFMGERCDRKYLNQSYYPENYVEEDEIMTSQNDSKVDNRTINYADDIIVTEIYVESSAGNVLSEPSAGNKVSITVHLLLATIVTALWIL